MQDLQELNTRIKTTRSTMAVQFAILDDRGQVFGMGNNTYVSAEAAQKALDFLRERREEMRLESQAAARELVGGNWDNETAQRKFDLEGTIDRWQREKDRRFHIARREVTPWVPLAPLA